MPPASNDTALDNDEEETGSQERLDFYLELKRSLSLGAKVTPRLLETLRKRRRDALQENDADGALTVDEVLQEAAANVKVKCCSFLLYFGRRNVLTISAG